MKKVLWALPKTWRIALFVGSLLTLVNQWELLWGHGLGLGDCPRLFMNFLVPWFVSAYSRVAAGHRP